ncbi:MAG: IS630 transposase-related protein [Moraxella sp.]|nr:IS630 transposase-related protein [Moraxella sp.]
MAHSIEIRQKAMDYLARCNSVTKVATAFGISRNTLYQWIKIQEATGSLAHSSGGYRNSKIDKEQLKAYIEQHPDAYLYEIAQRFDCTVFLNSI